MRVLRQYPVSIEAEQARTILDGLKIKVDDTPARFVTTHTHDTRNKKLAKPPERPGREPAETEWKALWQQFGRLPYLQKRILMFVLMFIVLIAVFTPFLWVFAFLILVKRTAVKQLLHKVLLSLDPEAPRTG